MNPEVLANQPGLAIWKKLCELKTCTHCKAKVPPIIPHPGEMKHLKEFISINWLVHMKTTHGMEPEDIMPFLYQHISPPKY